jgi:hypothetical protein
MKTIIFTAAAARQFDALPGNARASIAEALDASSEELVVSTKAEYEALVDAAEELADIAGLDAAKADIEGSKPLTAEETARLLKGR